MNSLRFRLLIATSVSSLTVLTLLCISVYAAMSRFLFSDYDAGLMARARALSAGTEQRNGRVKIEFDPDQMPEFSASKDPAYFELWLDNGQTLLRSQSLKEAHLPRAAASTGGTTTKLKLPGTERGRCVGLTFTPLQEFDSNHGGRFAPAPVRTCTIVVGGTPVDAERMLRYLGWLLLVLCTLAIVSSGAILLRVVSRGVRPVKQLAREIENVHESDLTTRLQPRGVPQELAPVVDKLNGLLDRLATAFAREKAFVADVAHELRTPLAGLLATLEVCRSRPRDRPAYESAIDACRGMTERMQTMIESLLMLARADAGQLPIDRRAVNVSSFLKESWFMFQQRAQERRLRIQWDACERCETHTDPDKLRIVIDNLFDNAVSYTEENGTIRVGADVQNDRLIIVIANTGNRVVTEDMPHLFERFWRGDRARSETGLHCGLGLSLARRLTHLLGGDIAADASSGGEFIVRVSLPSGRLGPAAVVSTAWAAYQEPPRLAPVAVEGAVGDAGGD